MEERAIPIKINFVLFFHHLMAEGNYAALRYLSAIDFGNEVWFGNGETMVTRYRYDVKATVQGRWALYSNCCTCPLAASIVVAQQSPSPTIEVV
jgi:hypothetical protein